MNIQFSLPKFGKIWFIISLNTLIGMPLIGQVDVSLNVSTDLSVAAIGDEITFSIRASNIRQTDISNLIIQLDFPTGLTYQTAIPPLGTTYDAGTKIWTIDNQLTATVSDLTLMITLTPNMKGTHFLIAEVISIDRIEYNSTANNGNFMEDDIAVGCVSIPILIELGIDSVNLTAPSLIGGHQWLKKFNTGTETVSNDSIFIATEPGVYNYENTDFLCEAISCCDIIIEAIEPCNLTIEEITCDDNATINEAGDDTFSVKLNATASNIGSFSQYLISYNNTILNVGGTNYGTSTTITHSDFVADGTANFTVTISDTNDAACDYELTFTAPPNCSVFSDCSFYTTLIEDNCCKICPTGNVEIITPYWQSDYINMNNANLALHKPSIFNGTPGLGNSNANLATDGNYEGDISTNFDYAFSIGGDYNRWDIDLVGHYDIESINIYTKASCCNGNATNYRVFIANSFFETADYQTLLNDASIANFSIPLIINGNVATLNNVNTLGRFVRVFLEGSGQMQLVEVEIIGSGYADSNPYHYNWSDPNIGNNNEPDCLAFGTYQVTITDIATGCETSQEIIINP